MRFDRETELLFVIWGLLVAVAFLFLFSAIVAWAYVNGGSIVVNVDTYGEGLLEVGILFGVVLPICTIAYWRAAVRLFDSTSREHEEARA